MQHITTDILVIGSGAAGLSAAVYGAKAGAHVLVLDKGAFGKSGSTVGAVQIAGIGSFSVPEDSAYHYGQDISESGRGLSDPDLITALTNDIKYRLNDLIDWGLKLDKNDRSEVAVSMTSGHTIPRSISAKKGKSGLGMLQTLAKKAKTFDNLSNWSDVITLELVTIEGEVRGAIVYDLVQNEPYFVRSNAVILATGGIGQLYSITSNPVQATGDGFSLGLGAGVQLLDMEQIQFYPVSLLRPSSLAGLCMSFYHLGKLYNRNGERFMENYEPETMENTTRDKLSIAIGKEIAAGRGSENHGVWLDATDKIQAIQTYFPHEYKLCLERGIDLAKEAVEIGPAAHFLMGGIQINSSTSSSVPGLFAAGETSGGLHGGNRLGNNALSECIVFGAIAGKNAAASKVDFSDFPEIPPVSRSMLETIRLSPKGNYRPTELKQRIRQVLDHRLGVIRSTAGLSQAKSELDTINSQLADIHLTKPDDGYSREVLDFIEVFHMLRTAQALIFAAAERTESRGAHFNGDYDKPADNVKHTLTYLTENHMASRLVPVKGV